jgi:hypothetical protein
MTGRHRLPLQQVVSVNLDVSQSATQAGQEGSCHADDCSWPLAIMLLLVWIVLAQAFEYESLGRTELEGYFTARGTASRWEMAAAA